MMKKKGQLGSSVVTMYRVFVIIVVAVIVLGASSLIYSYHINVRDSEAMILVREISGCVISEGVVDLDKLSGVEDIFEHCGYEEDEMKNFFVSVSVKIGDEGVFRVEGGDSGLSWVVDIYKSESATSGIRRYKPGYFVWTYGAVILDGGDVLISDGVKVFGGKGPYMWGGAGVVWEALGDNKFVLWFDTTGYPKSTWKKTSTTVEIKGDELYVSEGGDELTFWEIDSENKVDLSDVIVVKDLSRAESALNGDTTGRVYTKDEAEKELFIVADVRSGQDGTVTVEVIANVE